MATCRAGKRPDPEHCRVRKYGETTGGQESDDEGDDDGDDDDDDDDDGADDLPVIRLVSENLSGGVQSYSYIM